MRVLRTILGMLLLMIGLPALLFGAGLWAAMQHRDAGGAYSGDLQRLVTPGYAVVVEDVDRLLRTDAPFTRVGRSELSLAASTQDGPAFLGLAPSGEVERYLATVPHSTINSVDIGTGALPVATTALSGHRAPAAVPGRESFWTRTGLGRITWQPGQVHGGPYSLVVMNPGAKPGLHLAAVAELRPSWLNPTTWAMLTLGPLLVMAGLIALAWPVGRREVVYVVEPSQVPDLVRSLGAVPLNRTVGAHRPRTLADAQRKQLAALSPARQLTWPPAPAVPSTAAEYATALPPTAAATATSARAAVPAGVAVASRQPVPADAALAAVGVSLTPAAPAGSAQARAGARTGRHAAPSVAELGTPVGERSPAPGEPLSYLGAKAVTGPATDSTSRRRPDGEGRRRAPEPDDLRPFRAAAVDAWVAETAPVRARETEAQAAARLAEAARKRTAKKAPSRPGGVAQPGGSAKPGGAAKPTPATPSADRPSVHPSHQRVSVVTGPAATDWAATGLTRADSPRIGHPAPAPASARPESAPAPAGSRPESASAPAGSRPESAPARAGSRPESAAASVVARPEPAASVPDSVDSSAPGDEPRTDEDNTPRPGEAGSPAKVASSAAPAPADTKAAADLEAAARKKQPQRPDGDRDAGHDDGTPAATTAPAPPRPAPPRPAQPARPVVPAPARPSSPPQPTRSEPARSEVARSEPARTEVARSEPARSEPARSEPARSEPARTETAPAVVAAQGGRPTPAPVIAQVQAVASTVDSDTAMPAHTTQPIHLVMPGHPATTRTAVRADVAGGSHAVPDLAGAGQVALDVAATGQTELEQAAPDEPATTGKPAASAETRSATATVDKAETQPARPGTGPRPDAESRLFAQAQSRVDGTFVPGNSARPTPLGLGRPTPAAWRKAAESVAARVAGAAQSTESAATSTDGESPDTPPVTPAKSVGGRASRAKTKADTDTTATEATTTRGATRAKAAKTVTATSASAKERTTVKSPAKSSKSAATEASTAQAADQDAVRGTTPVRRTPRSAAGAASTGTRAARTGRSATAGAGSGTAKAQPTAPLSYKTEAAELLAGTAQRRRRRSPAQPEPSDGGSATGD